MSSSSLLDQLQSMLPMRNSNNNANLNTTNSNNDPVTQIIGQVSNVYDIFFNMLHDNNTLHIRLKLFCLHYRQLKQAQLNNILHK